MRPNPRKAPAANPYALAGVVPRADREKVVALDAGRQRRGRRVERATDQNGRSLFKVIVPTPRLPEPEDSIALDRWTEFPMLAEPVAHALLDRFETRGTPHSRRTLEGSLAHFADFLLETVNPEERGKTTLKVITTSRVGAYIKWLNRIDPEAGVAALAVATKRQSLGALRAIVAALRRGRWSGEVDKNLQILERVWVGQGRQSIPTAIIPREEFGRLYRACVSEVVALRTKVELGRRVIDAARDSGSVEATVAETRGRPGGAGRRAVRGPTTPSDGEFYNDLGLRLAAIEVAWGGLLPEKEAGLRTHRALMNAVLRHGGLAKHGRYFYPSSEDLVPFVVLLTVHTAYNPDTILGSTFDDITREPAMGTSRLVFEPAELEAEEPDAEAGSEAAEPGTEAGGHARERLRITAYKGRSRARQHRSFPVTPDPDNPAELLALLERWTERIRPLLPPRHRTRVFAFVTRRRTRTATTYVNDTGALSNAVWKHSLKEFCHKRGVRPFTLRQVRHTMIDKAHELTGGDLRAVLAVGGQRSAETIHNEYTSSGARERNYERLAEAKALMWRDRMTNGRADARRAAALGTDVGAATPGWGCLDPYDSPIPGQRRGRACEAYGRCPGCPLADLDTTSAVSCAHAHDLLARVDEARETTGSLHWLETWGPVRKRLAEYWLPLFSELTRLQASALDLRRIPPVE